MHDADRVEAVLRYHERSKHQFHRYARSTGSLDWVNQPDPFRRYEGAPLIQLPILDADEEPLSPRYDDLYRRGSVPSAPLSLRSLSRLFEYALALSAWKQAGGTRWALRSNPSSGNLHPTEGYLLIGALAGLADAPGLYHYALREHGLERRASGSAEWFAQLLREFPPQAFLVGLSSRDDPVAWTVIDEVALASRKPISERYVLELFDAPAPPRETNALPDGSPAGQIIRQRRSLLACDGRTSITAERFCGMLARVMPRVGLAANRRPMPWDAIAWEPRIHLALFVHRVDGLDSGLYMLVRDPAKLDKLKRAMHQRFDWSTPPGCPADTPLRLLEVGDARRLVEAEAAGVAATGIGCFFDDPVHQVFGFSDLEFQSLYHFTIGGPVHDSRLTTLAPYAKRSLFNP